MRSLGLSNGTGTTYRAEYCTTCVNLSQIHLHQMRSMNEPTPYVDLMHAMVGEPAGTVQCNGWRIVVERVEPERLHATFRRHRGGPVDDRTSHAAASCGGRNPQQMQHVDLCISAQHIPIDDSIIHTLNPR